MQGNTQDFSLGGGSKIMGRGQARPGGGVLGEKAASPPAATPPH